MKKCEYFLFVFGRPKEMYPVILRASAEKTLSEFEKDFIAVSKTSVNSIIVSEKENADVIVEKRFGSKYSDFVLINMAIKGLFGMGYKTAKLKLVTYYIDDYVAECGPGEFRMLDENFFSTPQALDEKDEVCVLAHSSGWYAPRFDILLYRSPGKESVFENDCKTFFPIEKDPQDINVFRPYLRKKRYKQVLYRKFEFYCEHRISDHWEKIIGKRLFKKLKSVDVPK